ncbi:MAG: DUF3857 domain-containing protein, partial [Mucilaginibacter sp.]
MKTFFLSLTLLFATLIAKSQIAPYGIIDTAALKIASCDFEKSANAMVLFDKAKIVFTMYGNLMERHRRIKILNDKGKEQGNIKIEYHNIYGVDHILNLEAQTINLVNGKIIFTKVDPKLFYPQHTDENKDAIVFSFPDVKPGSILEYTYSLEHKIASNFPAWYFQSDIPTLYSELSAYFDPGLKFKSLARTSQSFLKDTSMFRGHIWAMANIKSSKQERYARSRDESLESVALLLDSVNVDGKTVTLFDTWSSTGKKLANDKDYYNQLDQDLNDEKGIVKKALALKTNDEKIAFLFNEVKRTINWNNREYWASKDGIKAAWKQRSGNSAEVNAILYHLLKKSGIKAYPMLVSTRENGALRPDFVNIIQINGLVAYVPVDSTKCYVLDATDKYNTYNEIPYKYLNSYGLCLSKENDKYDMVFIKSRARAKEVIIIKGDIGTDAKMTGTTQIASY